MTNLTPTELSTLNATGYVRVVRVMNRQPDDFIEGVPVTVSTTWAGIPHYTDIESPFPSAGTREVIDGIAVVWGESGYRQFEQVVDTQFAKVFNKIAALNEPFGISRIQRECCLGYVKASRNLEAMLKHGLAKPTDKRIGRYATTASPMDAGLYVWVGNARKDDG